MHNHESENADDFLAYSMKLTIVEGLVVCTRRFAILKITI